MIKEDFNKLEVSEQLEYINNELIKGKSLRSISEKLNMSKTTIRDRFKKISYVYNAETKQYYRDNSIKQATEPINKVIQKDNNSITGNKVIQKDNKSISEVAVIKKENISIELQQELKTTLAEVKELIEMKDQLKEVIQSYNRSKSIIDIPESQELKIDKSKFDGDPKGRLIKIYSNVNDAWMEFCRINNQFKMQDLYSMALLEYIEKYKK